MKTECPIITVGQTRFCNACRRSWDLDDPIGACEGPDKNSTKQERSGDWKDRLYHRAGYRTYPRVAVGNI